MFGHTETDTSCDWSPSRFQRRQSAGITSTQVLALRKATLLIGEEMPSEDQCAQASDILKAAFPEAYQGKWWEEVLHV
ncbi:MAG: hypothetical protein KKF77_01325 [Proteobacteria bacterium]|nr:hypothetical protein [Pseudomonadota bacterium]